MRPPTTWAACDFRRSRARRGAHGDLALNSEIDKVRERYARRRHPASDDRYSAITPYALYARQERERAIVRLLRVHVDRPLATVTCLEVGCGSGGNLLQLISLGFAPANLAGNELLAERAEEARRRLPAAVRIVEGDATVLDLPDASHDIVYQSTVFSSLLDDTFQVQLADRMWRLVKPGGGILWYDFIYDNPSNRDVRGVPVRRVAELFPNGRVHAQRVTLAPPIGRRLSRVAPAFIGAANALPFLRTHVVVWIAKS